MGVRIKKLLVFAAIFVVISPCFSCLAWSTFSRRVTTADLMRIEKGMSKHEVLAIVGRPNHEESGGTLWAYYAVEAGIFAPFSSMYIEFDENDKVLARFS